MLWYRNRLAALQLIVDAMKKLRNDVEDLGGHLEDIDGWRATVTWRTEADLNAGQHYITYHAPDGSRCRSRVRKPRLPVPAMTWP